MPRSERFLGKTPGGLVAVLLAALALSVAGSSPASAGDLIVVDGSALDWAAVFDADGRARDDQDNAGLPGANGVPDYVDLTGGGDAFFIADDVSAGAAIDTMARSVVALRPVDYRIIAPQNDLANVYSFLAPSGVLYLGIERVSSEGDSSIALELNQQAVRLGHGMPWELLGDLSPSDARVRLIFAQGLLDSIVFEVGLGSGGAFQYWPIAALAHEGCNESGTLCVATNHEQVASGPWSSGQLAPGTLLELSADLPALLGSQVPFASLLVSTPEDLALGYFGEGGRR